MRHMMKPLAIAAAVAILATAANASTDSFLPSVVALDQKLKSDEVSITYAYMPQKGKLVILSTDPEGKAKTVIGSIELAAGDHRDVKVQIKDVPEAGAHLKARVEADTDQPFSGSDERAKQLFKVM
jgi:hypothetical protein